MRAPAGPGEAEGVRVDLGETPLTFRFLTAVTESVPQVQGDVVIGQQTVSLKDGGIVLEKRAGLRTQIAL